MDELTEMEPRPEISLISPTPLLFEYVQIAVQRRQFSLRKYETFESFLSVYEGMTPGCVVLSVAHYDSKATDFLRRLRAINKNAQVILSVCHWRVHDIVHAIQQGFTDFLEFATDAEHLSTTLLNAIERDRTLREARHFEVPQAVLRALNPEEIQIFRLIVQGKTTKQICVALDLSVRTVHYRKTSIFGKLGVRDRSEAYEIVRMIRRDPQVLIPGPHVTKVSKMVASKDLKCPTELPNV